VLQETEDRLKTELTSQSEESLANEREAKELAMKQAVEEALAVERSLQEEKLAEMNNEAKLLNDSLEETKAKLFSIEQQLNEADSSKQALTLEVETLKKELEEANVKISETLSAPAPAIPEPVDNSAAIEEAVQQALKAQAEKHQAELDILKSQVSELEGKVSTSDNTNKELVAKVSELESNAASVPAAEKAPIKVCAPPPCIQVSV
jgi:CII-binding regulator of phage lambda lysogenization HflD